MKEEKSRYEIAKEQYESYVAQLEEMRENDVDEEDVANFIIQVQEKKQRMLEEEALEREKKAEKEKQQEESKFNPHGKTLSQKLLDKEDKRLEELKKQKVKKQYVVEITTKDKEKAQKGIKKIIDEGKHKDYNKAANTIVESITCDNKIAEKYWQEEYGKKLKVVSKKKTKVKSGTKKKKK